MLKYVDLFAGCGGLSLGLESVGCSLVLAVEKSPMAAETLFRNIVSPAASADDWRTHLSSELPVQAKAGLVVGPLSSVLGDDQTMANMSPIDIVVGGPPCQGFSLAGRRNPGDERNRLAWEFLEFVNKTRPNAVVIENVVGMNRRFSGTVDSVFSQLREALKTCGDGYVVQAILANAIHYGAAQHRPRMLLIGLRADIAESRGITATADLWRSEFIDSERLTSLPLAPKPTVTADAPTLQDAIGDLQLSAPSSTPHRASAYQAELRELEKYLTRTYGPVHNQGRRRHTERVMKRFRLYQWMSANNLPKNAMQLIALNGRQSAIEIATQVPDTAFPAESPDGSLIAANSRDLLELLLELQTRKHSQRVLSWNKPSPTIVTLPDDYVHPTEPRILTVRESARVQGFPDSFVFYGKETTGSTRRRVEVPQYSQVGNAVSPFVGRAVGKMLTELLREPQLA